MKNQCLGFKILLSCFTVLLLFAHIDAEQVSASTETIEVIVEYHQEMARPIFDMINDYRTSGNAWYWNSDNVTKTECGYLPALQYDYDLEKVAMQRAAEISVFYSHTRPDGNTCWTTYSDCGYSEFPKGENIAAGYTNSNEMHIGWMEENDPYSGQGHRRNILNSSFNAIGIACVYSNGCYYWVEEFSGNCKNPSETIISTEPSIAYVQVETNDINFTGLAIDTDASSYYAVWDIGPADNFFSDEEWVADFEWLGYIGLYEGETIDNPITGCLFKYNEHSTEWIHAAVLNESGILTIADTSIAKIVDNKIEAVSCGVTELVSEIRGQRLTFPLVVGHKYEETLTPATKKADGFAETKCLVCGDEKGSTVIPKIGTVSISEYELSLPYNGKRQKPDVLVLDSNGNYIDESYYTVKYSKNRNIGTATAAVTFRGNYKGEEILHFTITPKPVTIKSVSTKKGVVVKWKKLKSRCDGYEIEYSHGWNGDIVDIIKIEDKTEGSCKLPITKDYAYGRIRIRSYRVVDEKVYYSAWSNYSLYYY